MNEVNLQEPQMADVPSEPREYIPSIVSMLREFEINIQFLSRGCVVRVGCKSIPFEDLESAMKQLNKYVNDPYTTRKEWERILD